MTREEMMAAGLVPEETKHNGHRRAHFHDYNRPGVYMITMVTEGRQRLFGQIVGHTRGAKGTEEYPHLLCSVLGERILQEEIAKISKFYKMVEVMKVALMPDHIHLLLNVRGKLPEGEAPRDSYSRIQNGLHQSLVAIAGRTGRTAQRRSTAQRKNTGHRGGGNGA